jgi:U3 small nucleolar RNA-associated protein 22
VRRELLVGFDPLPLYTAQLQQRLADLAVVCADHVGGTLLALKWRAAALAPAPLRPHTAHLSCPAGSPEAAPAEELLAARGKAGGAAAGGAAVRQGALSAAAVVPDVVGVLADVLQLGEGLVESIQLQ